MPERFTLERDGEAISGFERVAAEVRADSGLMEELAAYTLTGDTVADAYAALQTRLGFRKLADMLVQACERGVETVTDRPPELDAFIAAMEATPDWIDVALVQEGAGEWSRTTSRIWCPLRSADRSL